MADLVFNIAKGADVAYLRNVVNNSPANSALVMLYLTAKEADDVIRDYDNLSTLLAAAGNTEATFTNYARAVITDAGGITITVDDTANTVNVDIPNPVINSAGGATNNTIVAAVFCYDPDTTSGTDADLIPLYKFDVSGTTNGNTLTFNVNASGLITH